MSPSPGGTVKTGPGTVATPSVKVVKLLSRSRAYPHMVITAPSGMVLVTGSALSQYSAAEETPLVPSRNISIGRNKSKVFLNDRVSIIFSFNPCPGLAGTEFWWWLRIHQHHTGGLDHHHGQ